MNFFQPSFKVQSKQRDGALVRKHYHPPLTPCQRLLASPAVDEVVKQQLRQQFAALDPVALLKTIRDTQQELAAVSHSNAQPPARASQDLAAFLDGLATAWQNDNRPPQGRRKAAIKHCWRTRVDPFAHSWPQVENWLRAEPDVTAKALMQRLREQLPDVYPTGAQLRTLHMQPIEAEAATCAGIGDTFGYRSADGSIGSRGCYADGAGRRLRHDGGAYRSNRHLPSELEKALSPTADSSFRGVLIIFSSVLD